MAKLNTYKFSYEMEIQGINLEDARNTLADELSDYYNEGVQNATQWGVKRIKCDPVYCCDECGSEMTEIEEISNEGLCNKCFKQAQG